MMAADRASRHSRLDAFLLGADPKQRRFVVRTLMALAVYGASMLAEVLAIVFGLLESAPVEKLLVFMFVGPVVFVALVRSGWSRRFADPALTLPQMLFAIAVLTLGYGVNGPMRGLNLLLVALVPLFGFLTISRGQARVVCAFSLASLGTMMIALVIDDPQRYPLHVEALTFATAALCLPVMVALLGRIAAMRARSRAQGDELRQALRSIEALSIRDELTGLFNRRHMTETLAEELRRRQRGGTPFCLAIVDIDHFKRINDAHGHGRGDEVLRHFARIASESMDGASVLARWGGEEFLVLLPHTNLAAAESALAHWRERSSDPLNWPAAEAALSVKFSAGLVEDRHRAMSALLELADKALYRAKAGGRDRIEADRGVEEASRVKQDSATAGGPTESDRVGASTRS